MPYPQPGQPGPQGPTGPTGPQGPAGGSFNSFYEDIFDWSGSKIINDGQWVNFAGIGALTKNPNGTAGIVWDGVNFKLPPAPGWSGVTFTARLVGTIAGGTGVSREWKIQMRRTDGVTVIGSSSTVKVDGNDISNRDITLTSWTYSPTDPFTVNGVQVGIENVSGQTITLSSISVRIQRVINPT